MALLFIDLNDLKSINDRLGHEKGDEALVRSARVLTAPCESQIWAPASGEMNSASCSSRRARVGEVIDWIRSKAATTSVGGLPLSLSIGAATWESFSTASLEEVLHQAYQAMYEDKRGCKKGRP